jgi:hypothetical protein
MKIDNPSSLPLQKLTGKTKSLMLIYTIHSLKDFSLMKKGLLLDHRFEKLGKSTALESVGMEDLLKSVVNRDSFA